MQRTIRIGTRESQLAVWQANLVKEKLLSYKIHSELVYIRSEGDMDLTTPLYAMGVQGVFTRSLDIALLNNRIDIAVHSMKDVPTQLPEGIIQAAVLERGPVFDLIVYKGDGAFLDDSSGSAAIATSSIRRKAQWLNRYPNHSIHNLRGNVNTRLRKLQEENWDGAIFAQAGLERIGLRPINSRVLDWMLPAPAQGAIMIVCRMDDTEIIESCSQVNDTVTSLCTRIERDFLRGLLGGCSTPISGYAYLLDDTIHFMGNIISPDGTRKAEILKQSPLADSANLGSSAAEDLLAGEARPILELLKNAAE